MLAALLPLLFAADTIRLAPLGAPGIPDVRVDAARWGAPTIRLPVADGVAGAWIGLGDSGVIIAVRVPDTTASWSDRLVIALDSQGDRSSAPDHDDFSWVLNRMLDSSVVYRGNGGRWQPPRADPDWRLGPDHQGGGWSVSSSSDSTGWQVVIRFDLEYFSLAGGRGAGLEIRIVDSDARSSSTWPAWPPLSQPAALDDRPERWGVVRETGGSGEGGN